QAGVTDNVAIARVQLYVDNVLRGTDTVAPYAWSFDPTSVPAGTHTVTVVAYDRAGNAGRATMQVTTRLPAPPPTITIPQHYSHIRIAELAYDGTPLGTLETQLLQHSVDVVIVEQDYLAAISAIAPNTPTLIYTNFSSLYTHALTDYLYYAYTHHFNPEGAFYHA